jgi:triphosphoribosyl-dephospho-CoA synthase
MARHPDSLIARKCGRAVAEEAARRARQVLQTEWQQSRSWEALAALDAWLRADGRRRNPGTTADVLTASLFVALRQGAIPLPASQPWQR